MDKYEKRFATPPELASLGWRTEDGKHWASPVSGAWYSMDELMVVSHAWIDGQRMTGPWLVVESNWPLSERYRERLSG